MELSMNYYKTLLDTIFNKTHTFNIVINNIFPNFETFLERL